MRKVTLGKRRGRRRGWGRHRGRGPERCQWVYAARRQCREVGFDKQRCARRRLTRRGLQGCGRGRRWRIFVGWLQVPTSVKVRDASRIGEADSVEGLGGDAVLGGDGIGGLSSSARKANCSKWCRALSHVDCRARITGLGGGCASEDAGGVGSDVGSGRGVVSGRDVVSDTGGTTTRGTEAEAEEKRGDADTSFFENLISGGSGGSGGLRGVETIVLGGRG